MEVISRHSHSPAWLYSTGACRAVAYVRRTESRRKQRAFAVFVSLRGGLWSANPLVPDLFARVRARERWFVNDSTMKESAHLLDVHALPQPHNSCALQCLDGSRSPFGVCG